MKHKVKNIHFVGIGGSGMSGIAEVLLNLGYTISGSDPTDWTFAIPNSNGSTIEAKGSWNWGHHKDIPNAVSANYTAKLLYTFPNPTGNYLSVTLFVLDGDRCGDYAYSTYTFKNTGLPGPGSQSIGSVGLVQ